MINPTMAITNAVIAMAFVGLGGMGLGLTVFATLATCFVTMVSDTQCL